MSKPYLLAVDDEEMNLSIIEDLLEESFDVQTVQNGQECLDSLSKRIPDLVLLDVMMPVLNGLETCKKIRETQEFQDIPVIFVSALASPNERLNGYDAGGDEYLTKPFDEDELLAKINLLLKVKTEIQKEISEKEFATKTAMTSMVNASETGNLISFMQSILSVNDLESLNELTKELMTMYGLEGCIMLKNGDSPEYFFSDGRIRPIEQDILQEAATQSKKIIEFSQRAIINEKNASILIRNMPDDEEMAGRYKDHLAVLIDTLEAKMLQINHEQHEKQHYKALKQTIESVSNELREVNQCSKENRIDNSALLGRLTRNVEKSFLNMGLEGSQEEAIIALIETAETQSDMLYEKGEKSAKTFDRIIIELHELLN